MISKALIVRRVIAQLTVQLEHLAGASRTMHADASDPQNKPEDKYDTRALETSYLASAQARQATETEQAMAAFQNLTLRKFEKETPIDLTALVELEGDGERTVYFIGPKGGGLEIEHKGTEILVITPESPLGKELVGKKVGEKVKLETRQGSVQYSVFSIQ